MMKTLIQQRPLIYTLDNIFSDSYCQQLIEYSERQTYNPATINVGRAIDGKHKHEIHTNVRNNDRLIYDSTELANTIYQLISPELPTTWDERLWELEGLNERFRYYRYGKGQRFKPHLDGIYERSKFCQSFLTLLFYLSDDFEGGETKFYRYNGGKYDRKNPTHVVEAKKGQALIFDHQQLHEGAKVTSGTKYVLRTDIMYRAIVM